MLHPLWMLPCLPFTGPALSTSQRDGKPTTIFELLFMQFFGTWTQTLEWICSASSLPSWVLHCMQKYFQLHTSKSTGLFHQVRTPHPTVDPLVTHTWVLPSYRAWCHHKAWSPQPISCTLIHPCHIHLQHPPDRQVEQVWAFCLLSITLYNKKPIVDALCYRLEWTYNHFVAQSTCHTQIATNLERKTPPDAHLRVSWQQCWVGPPSTLDATEYECARCLARTIVDNKWTACCAQNVHRTESNTSGSNSSSFCSKDKLFALHLPCREQHVWLPFLCTVSFWHLYKIYRGKKGLFHSLPGRTDHMCPSNQHILWSCNWCPQEEHSLPDFAVSETWGLNIKKQESCPVQLAVCK